MRKQRCRREAVDSSWNDEFKKRWREFKVKRFRIIRSDPGVTDTAKPGCDGNGPHRNPGLVHRSHASVATVISTDAECSGNLIKEQQGWRPSR